MGAPQIERPSTEIPLSLTCRKSQQNLCLRETTSEDVSNLIPKYALQSKWHSFGGISARLIKEAVPIISSSLDLSINKGVFPNDWKQAKPFPIYNEGPKTDAQFSHYRRVI